MQKIIKKFLIIYMVSFIIAGAIGGWLMGQFFQLNAMRIFAFFPIFFTVYSCVHIYVINRTLDLDARKLVNVYMALKLVKNLLAGAFVLYLFFTSGEYRSQLLIAFGSFYIIQLAIESFFLLSVEKLKKNS